MHKILKSKILLESKNILDPNSVFTLSDIKVINKNINILQLNQQQRELLQKELKAIKKIYKNEEDFQNYLLDNSELHFELMNIRNQCIFEPFKIQIISFYESVSQYIKHFYKNFENISSDSFMEIEGALYQLEYIKHFKVKELLASHNIYDFAYHKNYKEVIYIYSCFDKITTLFRMFYKTSDAKNIDKIYFSKHFTKQFIKDYSLNKIINSADGFIDSQLFKDFKNIRNDITHNHTMPMEEYFTNLYSFIGLFLLLYFINEILIPNLKQK